MGGRYGDGAVLPEDNAVFAEDWHARALALTLACGALGQWNIDSSRHARECLSPKDYTRFSYYEKWISALADLLVTQDMLTIEELRSSRAAGLSDLAHKALKACDVAAALARGGPSARDSQVVLKFAVGDRVRARRPARNVIVTGGHTRLPAYIAGAEGTVVLCHGAHVLPDSNGHNLGEAPEPLYAVSFVSDALWGKGSIGGDDEVVADLWQSYLEAL
jgi:nitrile hydratase